MSPADEGKRKQLGRGLSALFGDQAGEPASAAAQAAAAGGRSLRMIAVAQIRPNRMQPRRRFPSAQIEELAQSIRENGILQPILVRRDPDHAGDYELIAGERRWRAAQAAQVHEIPAVIQDAAGPALLQSALVENVQRQDLSPLEEAEAYRRLNAEFKLTQEEIADRVGKSRPAVANALRLLELPEEVKRFIEDGLLSPGHARAILIAPDPLQLADRIVHEGLTVRQAEQIVAGQRLRMPKPKGAGGRIGGQQRYDPRGRDADTIELERRLANGLGLKVELRHMPGREWGSLTLHYKNLDQLDDILERLGAKSVRPGAKRG